MKNIYFLFIIIFLSACSSYENLLEKPLQNEEEKIAAVSLEINPNIKINKNTTEKTENIGIPVKYLSSYDGDTYTFTLINNSDSRKIQSLDKQNTLKVRALLVNSSELKGKDGNPEPFSVEAKDAVRGLLERANTITLSYDIGERTDKYNRNLMYVFVDGTLLSVPLLEEGLLQVAYVNPPNTKYLKEYEAAQQIAKDNKLGLWSINYN